MVVMTAGHFSAVSVTIRTGQRLRYFPLDVADLLSHFQAPFGIRISMTPVPLTYG